MSAVKPGDTIYTYDYGVVHARVVTRLTPARTYYRDYGGDERLIPVVLDHERAPAWRAQWGGAIYAVSLDELVAFMARARDERVLDAEEDYAKHLAAVEAFRAAQEGGAA